MDSTTHSFSATSTSRPLYQAFAQDTSATHSSPQNATRPSTTTSSPVLSAHSSTFSSRSSSKATTSNKKSQWSTSRSNNRPSRSSRQSKSVGGKDFIAAIVEGRGTGAEIGMCFCDMRTSEVILSQLADSQTYVKTMQKLNMYEPSEILVPFTAVEPADSKLIKTIRENVPSAAITPVSRGSFNEASGYTYVKQYIIKQGSASLLLGIATKYFCLAATSAVMRHIEESRHSLFINHSVRFKYQGCQGSMIIDCSTARNLELTINLSGQSDKRTLFGVLNHTLTPMGARLLRSNILQPLNDQTTIETRLDSVEELFRNEDTFYAVRAGLKAFGDMDHLITSFIQVPSKPNVKHSEQSINHIIILKHTLQSIAHLALAVTRCKNRLLSTVHRLLTDPRLNAFAQLIDSVIEHNVVLEKTAVGFRNQRCFAVKAGCNGLLDVARQTYKETISDIFDVVNGYAEQYGIALKMQFNISLGYYLSTNVDQLEVNELPLIFINIVKKSKVLTFTTLELMKKNAKINDSLQEVYLMSDKIIGDLSGSIRTDIGALYKASEAVAVLDMLLSFAYQCTMSEYVRPEFSDTLFIKQGRHPIIEILHPEAFVPNNTYASYAHSFQIITGPNMSGKSTYLRQVALLNIMAQIGSFVPAERAGFRIMDQIFSRICNDDSIEFNASTFMVEMRETAYILESVSDKSLVIIDELGRGTSTHDGLGIAFAVCEELIRTKALVFFATHFQELTNTLTVYHNVVNQHLETEMLYDEADRPRIAYKYRLTEGSAQEQHYGLLLSKTLGLPEDILARAEEVSHKLEEHAQSCRSSSKSQKVILRRRALAELAHHLILIQEKSSRYSPKELTEELAKAQDMAMTMLRSLGEH